MHYNPNNPVWQFVSLCLRYFILNLFFLISIIPIVTIGPARAALYSTVFAFNENDDINLGREYIKRFKHEFKRGIGSFIIFVALIAVIAFAIVFWNALDTDTAYITLPILIIFGVLTFLTFEYYYPLQARYENTFQQTFRNSFIMPWVCFRYTLGILAIDVAASACFVFMPYLRFLFILLGFAWLAYAKALLYLKAFQRAGDSSSTAHENPDYSLPSASIQ